MVDPVGGHAWLLLGGVHGCAQGGMHGCSGGHAWLLRGGMCGIQRDTEIRSMSGRYASYWNTFLFNGVFTLAKTEPETDNYTVCVGKQTSVKSPKLNFTMTKIDI